jgi:hypothetical protein
MRDHHCAVRQHSCHRRAAVVAVRAGLRRKVSLVRLRERLACSAGLAYLGALSLPLMKGLQRLMHLSRAQTLMLPWHSRATQRQGTVSREGAPTESGGDVVGEVRVAKQAVKEVRAHEIRCVGPAVACTVALQEGGSGQRSAGEEAQGRSTRQVEGPQGSCRKGGGIPHHRILRRGPRSCLLC